MSLAAFVAASLLNCLLVGSVLSAQRDMAPMTNSPKCLPLPPGAVTWWRGESNAWDSVSINDASSSENLPASDLFTSGKVGAAFRVTYGYYLRVSASDELDVGAGPGFTVEGWVNPDTLSFRQALVGWNTGGNTRVANFGVGLSLFNAYAQAYLRDTNTVPIRTVMLSSPVALMTSGIWTHLALTFDKTSGVAALFVNGSPVAQTNLGTFRPQTKAPVYLGIMSPGGGPSGTYSGYPFSGALDEFAIYNRALSPAEIQAIVAADEAGKCVPTLVCAPLPCDSVAWWRGESNALDNVDSNHGVITGAVASPNGAVGKCFQFNGGYVRVPATSNLNVGLGSGLTVEAWVKPTFDLQPLIEWNGGTGTQGVNLAIIGDVTLRANLVSTSGAAHFIAAPRGSYLSFGDWQHVALTYDKASGWAALFVNGNPVTQTNIGSFTPRTDLPLYFGYRPPGPYAGSNTKFTGALDEISLYARALAPAEIRAIVMARSLGKCQEPPAIVTDPASLRVNPGSNVLFSIVATGNPLLRYQWFKNGAPLAGATATTLMLPAVQDADAGNYAVLVTNWFGRVLSSNAVLKVNHPPDADASATATPVVAPLHGLATVVLVGSRSSDPDHDPLTYTWWLGTNALATGVVAVVHLPAGHPAVALVVDDGLATSTNVIPVDILTPAEAITRLMSIVTTNVARSQPLLATLRAALAAVNHDHPRLAILELRAFQFQVRARVTPHDPSLAEGLTKSARAVIVALGGGAGGDGHPRIHEATRLPDGRFTVRLSGDSDRLHIVEASADLVNWEAIGVARRTGDGEFEFEDASAPGFTNRFYRIVSP